MKKINDSFKNSAYSLFLPLALQSRRKKSKREEPISIETFGQRETRVRVFHRKRSTKLVMSVGRSSIAQSWPDLIRIDQQIALSAESGSKVDRILAAGSARKTRIHSGIVGRGHDAPGRLCITCMHICIREDAYRVDRCELRIFRCNGLWALDFRPDGKSPTPEERPRT